jgi:hypothetical protein
VPPHPAAIIKDEMARKAETTFNRGIEMGPIHHLANTERRANFLNHLHGVDLDWLSTKGTAPMIQKLTSELRQDQLGMGLSLIRTCTDKSG